MQIEVKNTLTIDTSIRSKRKFPILMYDNVRVTLMLFQSVFVFKLLCHLRILQHEQVQIETSEQIACMANEEARWQGINKHVNEKIEERCSTKD